MTLIEEDFSLSEVMTNTIGVFKREAESKGLKLQLKIMDELDKKV